MYNQDGARTSKKETVLFEYKGGSSSTTLQGMSQDQYFYFDLNPNKEIIAQGSTPTTEINQTNQWYGYDQSGYQEN